MDLYDFADQNQKDFSNKVYATLLLMLVTTLVMCWCQRGDEPEKKAKVETTSVKKITKLKRHIVEDVKLRKISISAADLLIVRKGKEYELNPVMVDLLRTIQNKYRIYILTKVAGEDDSTLKEQKKKIYELIKPLVDSGIIKGEHRLMFSGTEAGEVAQIRQLAADLHIERDVVIARQLVRHMNKFHLVGGNDANIGEFVSSNVGKVLYFKDAKSYVDKIKSALK